MRAWRLAFLAGLLGGGVVAGAISPAAFEVPAATFTAQRAALGGLLVGVGASMGNGAAAPGGEGGASRGPWHPLARAAAPRTQWRRITGPDECAGWACGAARVCGARHR